MFASKPLPSINEIQKRLRHIFPEGTADRAYVTRNSSAKTVFVMLYVDAVQGQQFCLAPQHVYRFTEEQACLQDDISRLNYRENCLKRNYAPAGDRWYADNSREQIRDENIKDGFVSKGAVIVDYTVPTTSNRGRYSLLESFAMLFLMSEEEFESEALEWQEKHLSHAELSRVKIMQEQIATEGTVLVDMPNGERRRLSPGGSSLLAKAVIEEFSPRFFKEAAVLWISESGNKVALHDDHLLRSLGLTIDPSQLLPDMIIADLGGEDTLIVFIELVYSDGPMTELRKSAFLDIAKEAGFNEGNIAFISVFKERNSPPLKKRFSGIAVDSLIWCATEPDLLIWFGENRETPFKPQKWIHQTPQGH